jgi:MFS family permease
MQGGSKDDKDDDEKRPAAFKSFQRQWLAVYLVTMLADWLQGTHMYTLYTSYNQPAGALFGIGFTSSAIFGTFLGLFVDKYGRRLGCIMFCVLELVINMLEHVNDFHLLALGRVLGGLSTSLLFTSFESWMVSEHRKRGFKEDWIAETFALAQMGNGFMAVLAGVLAQMVADAFGDIGPFQLAIALTIIALVLVFSWEENYGGDKNEEGKSSGSGNIFRDSLACIRNDHKVLLLGLIQSFFEGAMYTFVIMWVPTLALMVPGGKPGTQDWEKFSPGQGWIFSAMMISISIGGELFAGMLKVGFDALPSLFCM